MKITEPTKNSFFKQILSILPVLSIIAFCISLSTGYISSILINILIATTIIAMIYYLKENSVPPINFGLIPRVTIIIIKDIGPTSLSYAIDNSEELQEIQIVKISPKASKELSRLRRTTIRVKLGRRRDLTKKDKERRIKAFSRAKTA